MDVKSAFLNDELFEKIYVKQPPSFVQTGYEDEVCLLKRALYGLKQAPRAWYHKIHMFFNNCGFYCSHADSNLYVLYVEDAIAVLIVLYVDDLIITGSRTRLIDEVTVQLSTQFEMTVLHYYLGMEIR